MDKCKEEVTTNDMEIDVEKWGLWDKLFKALALMNMTKNKSKEHESKCSIRHINLQVRWMRGNTWLTKCSAIFNGHPVTEESVVFLFQVEKK